MSMATNFVDIYDVELDAWTSTLSGAGKLSVNRSDIAAAAAGSKILFAGGSMMASQHVTIVDMYDVDTGVWLSSYDGIGQLSEAKSSACAASTKDIIVFAGGYAPHFQVYGAVVSFL